MFDRAAVGLLYLDANGRVRDSSVRVGDGALLEVRRGAIGVIVAAFYHRGLRRDGFFRVDEALYRAKREGRNRVAVAPAFAASVASGGGATDGT